MSAAKWSVIVPILNEADHVLTLIDQLHTVQSHGAEVIVVDGGSTDGTYNMVKAHGVPCVKTSPGRAHQMNAGARCARGEWLLFLHSDTQLPDDVFSELQKITSRGARWGWFDVRIAGTSFMLPLIGVMMSIRTRLTSIATGDQAIFVAAEDFSRVGGFVSQPLMEDIELCRQLRRRSRPGIVRRRATTSGRRWDTHGQFRTIALMWRLRFDYLRGIPAAKLAELYR